MPTSRSLRRLRSLAWIPAALLLASSANAASVATHDVELTLTLTGATFVGGVFDGQDASGGLFGFGFTDENVGISPVGGTGVDSGSSSFTINGAPPSDPDDFSFSVGDSLTATLSANASATDPDGPGVFNNGAHNRFLTFFIDFEDFDETFENILLDFDWSYTQSFDTSVMNLGDGASALFSASATIDNLENFSETVAFVVDENFGSNNPAFPFVATFMDDGSFSLLMDVDEGGAPSSQVAIEIEVGANASIAAVPEPSIAWLCAAGVLALAVRRRR